MALRLWLLVKSLPQETADRTKPPCCIFVLESHWGANQAKCWSRLSSCTLDLVLVIGHALFDWDKVITCYLFRHCPLQSAECTDSNISPLCLQILMIWLWLKYEYIRNRFQSSFVDGQNKSFSYLSGLSSLIKKVQRFIFCLAEWILNCSHSSSS